MTCLRFINKMSKTEDFKVLPLPFSKDSTIDHQLFIKEHSVKRFDEQKPPGRTLFVVNIPPYVTKLRLNALFSTVGEIERIFLQNNTLSSNESKSNFQIAYIVFTRQESLKEALKLQHLEPLCTETRTIPTSLQRWKHNYKKSIINQDQLAKQIDDFMKNYDECKKIDKLKESNPVDEDGWTVVTRKGRNPGLSRKESVEAKLLEKNKLKTKKKELKNFYTFQLKEQKMQTIAALRKSFQESKEKINAMKKLRQFKPF